MRLLGQQAGGGEMGDSYDSGEQHEIGGDDYLVRAAHASSRREAWYWDARFMVHLLVVEGPRMLLGGVRNRVNLLRGNVDPIGEVCRFQGCERDAIARVPGERATGNPACRRHYLWIKSIIYSIVIAAIGLVVGALVMVA
jgi:hypothetical protein